MTFKFGAVYAQMMLMFPAFEPRWVEAKIRQVSDLYEYSDPECIFFTLNGFDVVSRQHTYRTYLLEGQVYYTKDGVTSTPTTFWSAVRRLHKALV